MLNAPDFPIPSYTVQLNIVNMTNSLDTNVISANLWAKHNAQKFLGELADKLIHMQHKS